MNSSQHSGPYPFDPSAEAGSVSSPAEVTLRLIATLPAPDGLVERVQSGLHAVSLTESHTARIVPWPLAFRPSYAGSSMSWMHCTFARGAAAAAIVMVVVGGGWRVYSRVQPAPTARVIVMPARVGIGNGFATGGAMRTPETINGPVLKHPVQQPAEVETIARPDASPTAAPARRAHAAGSRTAKPSAAKPMQVTSAPRP